MVNELKLSTVVERAKLDRQTARYVLKHPETLSGMPEAGTQGVHRRFTLRQAVRLAVCTYLVEHGVPLAQAGPAVDFIERRVKTLSSQSNKGERQFSGDSKGPWLITFIDAKWLRVWKEGVSHRFVDDDDFVAIDDLKTISTVAEAEAMARVEINLTRIESRLAVP